MPSSRSCLEGGERDSPPQTWHLLLSFVWGWGGRGSRVGGEGSWLASLTHSLLPFPGLCPLTCQVGDRAGQRRGPCSVTALWTQDTRGRSGWPPRVRHSQGCPDPPVTRNHLTAAVISSREWAAAARGSPCRTGGGPFSLLPVD